MIDFGLLRNVERENDFEYDFDLWDIAEEFGRLSINSHFTEVFPGGRIAERRDQRDASSIGIPHGYAPFFCDDQPNHTDYYCCRKIGNGSGPALIAFADHAVVRDWEVVTDFIEWSRPFCIAPIRPSST